MLRASSLEHTKHNKSYYDLRNEPDDSSDDSISGLGRVECINMKGDDNKGLIYLVPEDMTDVILMFFSINSKPVPNFQSDQDVAYKEIFYNASDGGYSVNCVMYFVPKLKKGTGITGLNGGDYAGLVRIKAANSKNGNITKETISGSTYYAKETLKDVFLLQSGDGSTVPAFQELPGDPIITFKQVAGYSHPRETGHKDYYYYSLYYIPELKKSSAITRHIGGVLFY